MIHDYMIQAYAKTCKRGSRCLWQICQDDKNHWVILRIISYDYKLTRNDVISLESLLSVADASRILGVTPQTVRQMARQGTLPIATRTEGGIRLFRRADVEQLAAERATRNRAHAVQGVPT
jgi:excisionase family DNA binding protein